MNKFHLVFDIETGMETPDVLDKFFQYDETAVPGYSLLGQEFDEKSVKLGNVKNPDLIAEKIEKAREKFLEDQKAAELAAKNGEQIARAQLENKAPLNAIHGRVLAVGMYYTQWKNPMSICHIDMFSGGEKEMLETVLTIFESVMKNYGHIIGHNIMNFDLPFLCRRAFKYGIPIPAILTTQMTTWSPTGIIDTMRVWGCGDRREMVKLDDLAKFFGTTTKNGDGAMFHRLYHGTPKERNEALEYLKNDVTMTVEIAEKLGVYQR